MRKTKRIATVLLLTGAAALLGGEEADAMQEVELTEAAVFIEWNSTDTDYGIQFEWDGLGWTKMKCRNERGKTVFNLKTAKNLKTQSLTQGAFESREPPASELSGEQFLDRFPEGTYTFKGKGFDGSKVVGEADFAHTLAKPTTITSPQAGTTQSADGFTISFTEVTQDTDNQPLTVEHYTVVLESTGEDPAVEAQFVVLPGQTSLDIPGEFITPNATYKVEIIVQDEDSGNRTITETGEFSTDAGGT